MSPRRSTLKHVREWGASGSVRLDPGAAGRGLSFSLLLSRGSSGSGVARLWERSAAAGAASATARGRLESELGYARPAFAGMGAATLYTGLSVAQGGVIRFRVGARLDLGTAFDLDFKADRGDRRGYAADHGVAFRLSARWVARTACRRSLRRSPTPRTGAPGSKPWSTPGDVAPSLRCPQWVVPVPAAGPMPRPRRFRRPLLRPCFGVPRERGRLARIADPERADFFARSFSGTPGEGREYNALSLLAAAADSRILAFEERAARSRPALRSVRGPCAHFLFSGSRAWIEGTPPP